MSRRLSKLWARIGDIDTAVTLSQLVFWLFSGGAVFMAAWAVNYLATPWGITLGVLFFAGCLWSRNGLVRWARERRARQPSTLNHLRNTGVALLGETVASESELQAWEARVDAWRGELRSTLTAHYNEAIADSVVVIGSYSAAVFRGSFNKQHNNKLLMLDERIQRLDRLIADAAAKH